MNRFSRNLTQKKSQGASQAMLYATGLTTEDMKKAQVRQRSLLATKSGTHNCLLIECCLCCSSDLWSHFLCVSIA